MTENTVTFGFVVHRVVGGAVEFLGIVQTQEKADADIRILARHGQNWSVARVPFLGWGQVAPGVFSQNGTAPLRIVENGDGQ